MLPCIVIDFFLNNQPDALIILILFCYKTVYSALVSFMQVSGDRFQAQSGWNSSSILTVLESSRKLLMMGREDVRNM
jgi:hypothetical protein